MMRRAMIEGKCGLPALSRVIPPRRQRQLEDGPRVPGWRLGTTMMRRMIGRYKGCRCAGMVAGVKAGCWPLPIRARNRSGNRTTI